MAERQGTRTTLGERPAHGNLSEASETPVVEVAALFVEQDGVYAGLPKVHVWDQARDARLYEGPWPAVAHPPCARWSRLAGFTEARFGLRRGEDGGCFESALESVRRFGGVLEHPAHTAAFAKFGLPKPSTWHGWCLTLDGGAVCYVEQGRYGLPVKKATWLYAYGVDLPELRWGLTRDDEGTRDEGERPMGLDRWRDRFAMTARDKRSGEAAWRSSGHRGANYGLTSTTPPEFRDALLAMARTAPATSSFAASREGVSR